MLHSRNDYVAHPMPEKTYRPAETYKPPSKSMEGVSVYQQDYPYIKGDRPQLARRQETRSIPNVKFSAVPTYSSKFISYSYIQDDNGQLIGVPRTKIWRWEVGFVKHWCDVVDIYDVTMNTQKVWRGRGAFRCWLRHQVTPYVDLYYPKIQFISSNDFSLAGHLFIVFEERRSI